MPVRPVSTGAMTTLSVVRGITAAALLAAPQLTARLFFLDLPPTASILMRLVGTREAALGGLLLVCSSRVAAKPTAYREGLRLAILAGMSADVLDIVVGGFSAATGSIGLASFDMLAGGALLAIVLGAVGLRNL